jgi:hypothetical protein
MTQPDHLETEVPEADAAEQAVNADPAEGDSSADEQPAVSQSIEAPQWDAQEQAVEVPLEDEYR